MFAAGVSEAKRKEVVDKAIDILNEHKVEDLESYDWGRRDMAFQLKKNKFANYTQLAFNLEDSENGIAKLTAYLRIADGVIKFQTHRMIKKFKKFKLNNKNKEAA